jgi:predicted Zn-dependent peptidase
MTLELTNREAFRNVGLGNSLWAQPFAIEHIETDNLRHYVNENYIPEKMVLVGTGAVNHDELVKLAEATFGKRKGAAAGKSHSSTTTRSTYTGGEILIPGGFATHVSLAFQGASLADKDYFAFGALQFLLGAGKNILQEGPGKGSSGRLGRSFVAKNNWVYEASAYNVGYSDSGIFGVLGISQSGHTGDLVQGITEQLSKIKTNDGFSDEDLSRARSLFKNSILFHNESRGSVKEFLAQQSVVSPQNVQTPEAFAKLVDSVTRQDVQRAAQKAFRSKPTLVVLGDVANVPTVEAIQAKLAQ